MLMPLRSVNLSPSQVDVTSGRDLCGGSYRLNQEGKHKSQKLIAAIERISKWQSFTFVNLYFQLLF